MGLASPILPCIRHGVLTLMLLATTSCDSGADVLPFGPRILLTPASATVATGDSVKFSVTTAPPDSVRWTTSEPTVATVSATGLVVNDEEVVH